MFELVRTPGEVELRDTSSDQWATGPLSLFSDQFLIKLTLVLRYSSGSVKYFLNTDLHLLGYRMLTRLGQYVM